ncbi:FliM/FliN family flagellar motor switch protein [Roseicyclus mahoneyensis]|jgi:flagellar motor switch protein FliN|uniref:Flagellar motor switch protein FliN/FliY n=1 Tax=Roseicyclus mahoneyensis TaxID=164332 RepID=A0A316GFW3_9RHOB|nr:FliM/FliN family flagellar motor C-terminal domain-containing protein [Roseicyclus mahoneyensis]PWK59815.1 flagellar motor switch protein FliN/FliY [Roseicyclus mahoneyensis]
MSDPQSLLRAAALQAVPIEIRVSVGRARPLLREVMDLAPEAVLTLDSRIDDPVALYVGDRMIAEGELVELDGDRSGQLAVRIIRLAEVGHAGG